MKIKCPQKNPQKQGRILQGAGGNFLAGQNIYPCTFRKKDKANKHFTNI